MWSWRARVLAAEAIKAEGASEDTLRIPRPPSLTGRLAWTHCMSERLELVMAHSPCLRWLSNWSWRTLPTQGEDLKVYRILGALNDARKRMRASCEDRSLSLSMAKVRSEQRAESRPLPRQSWVAHPKVLRYEVELRWIIIIIVIIILLLLLLIYKTLFRRYRI
jgi:hypothetical protein